VQVDVSPPTLGVSCPATAIIGASGVHATVIASDGQSGLAADPSGSVPISTAAVGPQTVTRTAIDNVGHETTSSCTTNVIYAFSKFSPVGPVPKEYAFGKTVQVKFHLANASGAPIGSGVQATLDVAPVNGSGIVGSYQPATSTTNTGNEFMPGTLIGNYRYYLQTSVLSRGVWSLRVTLNDGTVHTTSIRLR
jgi:outer membrane protein W